MKRRARRAPVESTEQTQFVAMVRNFYPDVIIAAVPNGGYRTKTEATRLKGEGVLAGYPDLLIDEPRGFFHGMRIEMKRSKGGKVSKAQAEQIRRLRRRGYYVVVCRGWKEAWDEFERYMAQEVSAL